MTYTTNATAGMPLDLLVDKLARVAGAGLERRHVAALTALARALPRRSAAGLATAQQLADLACYSGRWMRDALAELEALGLLEWRRGGITDGRPAPSWFRVHKAQLVALVRAGVDAYALELARRSAATAARLSGLLNARTRHRRARLPWSRHAEVSADPQPFGEEPGAEGPPVPAQLETLTRLGVASSYCDHGNPAGRMTNGLPWCPACRRAGLVAAS